MNMFRVLRADEIDCRIAQIKVDGGKPSGLSLLLYKDARCDQNILDETVGPMDWKREHTRDNHNCIVSIWDKTKQQWISKEDTGTESNTEAAKGLASDSFKRSCFNWGIGRELYTAPFIWISAKDCNISISKGSGRPQCYDNFTVAAISYTDGSISGLKIRNEKLSKVVFSWGTIAEDKTPAKVPERPKSPDNEPQEFVRPEPAKAEVTEVKAVNPVQAYINNELSFMSQRFEISDKKEMQAKFMAMRKALIDRGIVENIRSDEMTMNQAKALVDAIYKNFLTDARDGQ